MFQKNYQDKFTIDLFIIIKRNECINIIKNLKATLEITNYNHHHYFDTVHTQALPEVRRF